VPPVVVDDPFEAARLVAAGHDVVLVVAPGRAGSGAGTAARGPAGPGRLAVYVATGDPADAERAAAMDAELFGRPT
jgi:hypothetical protein